MFVGEAKADVIVGSSTTSGILILNLAQNIMPVLSFIGIIAGTILALHGVYELGMRYYRLYKMRKHKE
jgi:hypothetical protein